MKEQLILFETAKLAKEKGFDEPSDTYVTKGDKYETEEGAFFKNSYGFITAPTQFLLQKWLREEHNIYIEVGLNFNDKFHVAVYNRNYKEVLDTIKNKIFLDSSNDLKTYEEALEQGLIEALKLV